MSDNFNRFYAEIHTKRYTTVKALVKAAWDDRQLKVQSLESDNTILREALERIYALTHAFDDQNKYAEVLSGIAEDALLRAGGGE